MPRAPQVGGSPSGSCEAVRRIPFHRRVVRPFAYRISAVRQFVSSLQDRSAGPFSLLDGRSPPPAEHGGNTSTCASANQCPNVCATQHPQRLQCNLRSQRSAPMIIHRLHPFRQSCQCALFASCDAALRARPRHVCVDFCFCGCRSELVKSPPLL